MLHSGIMLLMHSSLHFSHKEPRASLYLLARQRSQKLFSSKSFFFFNLCCLSECITQLFQGLNNIAAQVHCSRDIPIKYGGLKRENDTEFVDEKGGVLETLV